MKYIVLLGDGMADRPVKELGGRTPLEAAYTPNMDRLAKGASAFGSARTIPEGFPPGSDVANLSILGYNPREYYTGRSPLEAVSMGVELGDEDVAFRCNLVTLRSNPASHKVVMADYSSGHITTNEARELMAALNEGMKDEPGIVFHPGVSYRHLMLWKGGEDGADCTPPHDISDRIITDYLPQGPGGVYLNALMRKSVAILEGHEVNKRRVAEGKSPANSIWLWGQGKRPRMPLFIDKFGATGALVSAVDLLKGLGRCSGLRILDVPGMTGYLDTNYVGKAEHSLEALRDVDFVYIHVEAPDEAAHSGDVQSKVRAIEDFDAFVVGTMLKGLPALGDYRILLLPDHWTPLEIKTHSSDPVPYVLFDSTVPNETGLKGYSEAMITAPGATHLDEGYRLMDKLLEGIR